MCKRRRERERERIQTNSIKIMYTLRRIGKIETCFPECRGTPRQGLFTPSTRGRVVLDRSVISGESLENVDEYEYVWLTFVFDRNIKKKKEDVTKTRRAKIWAPKNESKQKVGVFSTRSPHRPNPVGMTLAKVESVNTKLGVLNLSGIDLVDQTPILDIKPYVPFYDAMSTAKTPAWVLKAFQTPLLKVDWSDEALSELENLVDVKKVCKFYESSKDVRKVLSEVLSQDMRSGNTARKRRLRGEKVAKEGMTFCFDFDGLRVKSVSTSETSVRVFRIENLSTTPRDSEKNHENSTVPIETTITEENISDGMKKVAVE